MRCAATGGVDDLRGGRGVLYVVRFADAWDGERVTLEYRVGDVFERLAEIPDGSIDLIVTSPPFLALRSYLPADHPDKHREIGSEATPADFLDTLLALSAEWGRVLAPHGSLCVELGDTYSGSGGAGGDYAEDGMRAGQPTFKATNPGRSVRHQAEGYTRKISARARQDGLPKRGNGWPLAKSLTGMPTLYPWSLAYGRNLLTGAESPAGQWRIRNLIVWARPNPPVGALGDKFRPATSYITVACRSAKRYFDLDAVRMPAVMSPDEDARRRERGPIMPTDAKGLNHSRNDKGAGSFPLANPAGAPPLDWHADDHPEDGDWLWRLSTQPYAGSHYATFPMALPKRLIEAMCPLRVCTVCGRPSERIVEQIAPTGGASTLTTKGGARREFATGDRGGSQFSTAQPFTLGWSDCGHDAWRTGIVLDPFAGSGTTLEAAQAVGRHAIGIDLDERNGWLARERCGMFLELSA